jgi:hypothetical protein
MILLPSLFNGLLAGLEKTAILAHLDDETISGAAVTDIGRLSEIAPPKTSLVMKPQSFFDFTH